MKKLALITITILGVATFVFAQEKKQTANKNETTEIGIGRLLTPAESEAFALDVKKENAAANNKTADEVTFIGKGTLIEKTETPVQKTAELNVAPVKAAPRAQESKPIAR